MNLKAFAYDFDIETKKCERSHVCFLTGDVFSGRHLTPGLGLDSVEIFFHVTREHGQITLNL